MHLLTLIVPDEREKQSAAADMLREALPHVAGGYSEYDGIGAWKNAAGVVIREPHARIEVACDSDTLPQVLELFRAYRGIANESAIFYIVDGKAVIEPIPVAA